MKGWWNYRDIYIFLYDILNLIILVRRAFYFVPAARSSLLVEIRDFSRADRGGSSLINSGRKPNMGIRSPHTLVNKESRAIN